jgi:hypothetical protein
VYHSFSFHCNTSRPMLDYCISKLSLGVVRTAYDAMREAMHREAEGAIVGPAQLGTREEQFSSFIQNWSVECLTTWTTEYCVP